MKKVGVCFQFNDGMQMGKYKKTRENSGEEIGFSDNILFETFYRISYTEQGAKQLKS